MCILCEKHIDTVGLINALIECEEGELNEEQTVALFQALIDSGLIWGLTASYIQAAQAYLKAGLIHE